LEEAVVTLVKDSITLFAWRAEETHENNKQQSEEQVSWQSIESAISRILV
jgi:hypothetical protein